MSQQISMLEAVARLRDLGFSVTEIAEAFARTGPGREDEDDVAQDIVSRRPKDGNV